MSSVAIVLIAGSLAMTPPAELQVKSPPPTPSIDEHGLCGPDIDPQFVKFVPGAAAEGRDGLFRLIAGPTSRVDLPRRAACEQELTRSRR